MEENFLIESLRENLKKAVEKNKVEGLLFSGGIDSSILAFLCPTAEAITVCLEHSGEDLNYAKRLASYLNIKHHCFLISVEEALNAIPRVIGILKTFDPAIPNDITVYFGLKFAKEKGMRSVMTGDGSDELFAGYSYMQSIRDLDGYIRKISSSLFFTSNVFSNFFKIDIIQPYLQREFVNFSLEIPVEFKIREDKGKLVGKWILRRAFENFLPEDIIWQNKRPLEQGSGTVKLRKIINSKISDDEFDKAKKDLPVRFINKEHFYYYKIYREKIGEIPSPLPDEDVCPGCGAGIKKGSFHCRVCGWAKKLF